MIVSIITLFPDLYEPFLKTSLIKRAQENNHVTVDLKNLFTLCEPKERVDSPTFGHGAGMLIRPDIVEKAVDMQEATHGKAYKIFFSPQGKKLDQVLLRSIAQEAQSSGHIMLLPARYEGMDARVEDYYADCVVSLGDFVLLGGDLPAMVLMEGFLRLLPGVVGKQESIERESFSGAFFDYPEHTNPVEWKNMRVPDVIRSGNHGEIESWRTSTAVKNTILHNFEWLKKHVSTSEEIALAQKHIPPHYAVLMHSQVILDGAREGTSSVTSIDIHDIARSARTYDIKKYFIVTPLADQQKIIKKLLEFWHTDVGIAYNASRHQAINNVILVSTLDEVLQQIEQLEGKRPLLLATAARKQTGVTAEYITYYDQEKVWCLERPVLFVFGAARGLSQSVIEKCEFILGPIRGFSHFNHLSVRSAAAVVFDRWLGINQITTV